MAQPNIVKDALSMTTNRRGLLKKLAMAGAAVTAAHAQTPAAAAGPTPADVVQFALNLEYLEAEFYSLATSGQTLSQRGVGITGTGTAGATTTQFAGSNINFGVNATLGFQAALNIAADEINHVIVLRAALTANGVTPVAKPAINLDALLPMGASLANQASFLILARIFEDIGVSAYSGAAPLLAGSPYLATAARITAVEGEHVANIRLQAALLGLPSPQLDAADVIPPPSGKNFFSTNLANGLCAVRTPGQVLYLAYGMVAGATAGGFFPNGVNGILNTSSAAATAANLT